jgi:hypothetical protein
MHLLKAPGILLLAAVLLIPAAAAAEEAPGAGVTGRVSSATAPLPRATVYAYELARSALTKVTTDPQGRFLFDGLPAGVYRFVAFKSGFEPAVVLLSRATSEAHQFVDLVLDVERPDEGRKGEGYWAIRDQIPSDVLRDMKFQELAHWSTPDSQPPAAFRGDIQAMTGYGELADGPAQLAGGGVGMEGAIGGIQVGVRGQFWHLAPTAALTGASAAGGQAATLAVRMAARGAGELDVTTFTQRLGVEDLSDSADFERYRVSWSQPLGQRSHSRFAAQYTSQNHFYQQGAGPVEVPLASRSLNFEGEYQIDLSDRAMVRTGVRFREREGVSSASELLQGAQRALELFGRGGWRAIPNVVVEYGLYTQLHDGTMALAPQGGLIVQLDSGWQLAATASRRLEEGSEVEHRPFSPLRFGQAGGSCQELDQHCYRIVLARQSEAEGLLSIGTLHREVAETLQLYFNDDFFSRLESLYLVRGDQIPELQLVVERRIAPRVVARLESSLGQGGGGILYAADSSPHENRVRYLVTSLDTRFQQSATGVFMAFHHLEQGLAPLDGGELAPVSELERLQLMLTQDLNLLMRLSSDWAFHVNYELSRGSLPFALVAPPSTEVRQRFTGGFTVKF